MGSNLEALEKSPLPSSLKLSKFTAVEQESLFSCWLSAGDHSGTEGCSTCMALSISVMKTFLKFWISQTSYSLPVEEKSAFKKAHPDNLPVLR